MAYEPLVGFDLAQDQRYLHTDHFKHKKLTKMFPAWDGVPNHVGALLESQIGWLSGE